MKEAERDCGSFLVLYLYFIVVCMEIFEPPGEIRYCDLTAPCKTISVSGLYVSWIKLTHPTGSFTTNQLRCVSWAADW